MEKWQKEYKELLGEPFDVPDPHTLMCIPYKQGHILSQPHYSHQNQINIDM